MKKLPTSHLIELAQQEELDVKTVDAALIELLDAVQNDDVPKAAQSEMHGFYDRYQSWRHHFLHHFSPFVCEADQVFQVRQQRPHLLDLGCGVATQSHLFALRGARVTGLDNNAARVAAGQAMTDWFAERADASPPNVGLFAEDAFAWLKKQPSDHFDGCYTQFALAYMRPHLEMLQLADRVVRPGGRLLFREFNAGSLYNRLIARVDRLSAKDYCRHGRQLGWRLLRRSYCWILPRQIINSQPARTALGPLENALTGLPVVGASVAASMTLVFEKPC